LKIYPSMKLKIVRPILIAGCFMVIGLMFAPSVLAAVDPITFYADCSVKPADLKFANPGGTADCGRSVLVVAGIYTGARSTVTGTTSISALVVYGTGTLSAAYTVVDLTSGTVIASGTWKGALAGNSCGTAVIMGGTTGTATKNAVLNPNDRVSMTIGILPESSATATICTGDGTSTDVAIDVAISCISQRATTQQGDTCIPVPEFGAPTMLIAAVGLLGVALVFRKLQIFPSPIQAK
jgi:hypothetical protein